ncbi:MAG: glycosyltransferase, partial [Cyclobacteriaceae bacterium]
MRKVLMVNSGGIIDGKISTSTFVLSQAKSLSNRWEVVWGLCGWKSTSILSVISNIIKLRQVVRNDNIDIIHAQYGSIYSFIGLLISRNKPFIVSLCGDDVLGTIQPGIGWRIREFIAKKLSLYSSSHADHIIVKSNNILNALPSKLQYKASVLPNGVDINFFKPTSKSESRNILGLSQTKTYVLFNQSTGNNLIRKNKELAIEVIRRIKKIHSADIELLVIGKIPHQQVPIYINASNAVLLTSIHEGSPNIIKEAMACNIPIVSV